VQYIGPGGVINFSIFFSIKISNVNTYLYNGINSSTEIKKPEILWKKIE
jgi:hypothetical protein